MKRTKRSLDTRRSDNQHPQPAFYQLAATLFHYSENDTIALEFKAMLNAIQNKFPSSQRQRCIKHKMENILAYVPKKQQDQVYMDLKAIFYQNNRQEADQVAAAFIEKYATIYPSAIACLQRDWEACLTFYSFPEEHWKFIRTTNIIERMFLEVKKRSKKMASAFRNENSCLLMFYAVIRGLKLRRISVPAPDTGSQNLHNS